MQENGTLLWPLMVNYGSHIHHLPFLPLTECIIFTYTVDFVHVWSQSLLCRRLIFDYRVGLHGPSPLCVCGSPFQAIAVGCLPLSGPALTVWESRREWRLCFCPRQERLLISDDIQRSHVTKEQIALICLTSIISVALFLLRYVLK